MLDTTDLVPGSSVSLYVDYPDDLDTYTDTEDIKEVIRDVMYAVTSKLIESHLSYIPVFNDTMYDIIDTTVVLSICDYELDLCIDNTITQLDNYVNIIKDIIASIIISYIPQLPETMITTIVQVVCHHDCVVITIHY